MCKLRWNSFRTCVTPSFVIQHPSRLGTIVDLVLYPVLALLSWVLYGIRHFCYEMFKWSWNFSGSLCYIQCLLFSIQCCSKAKILHGSWLYSILQLCVSVNIKLNSSRSVGWKLIATVKVFVVLCKL